MKYLKHRVSLLVLAVVGALIGSALFLTVPASAADGAVTAQDIAFQPASITVDVGDSVTWTNEDGVPHTVTADDGSFDEPLPQSGGVVTLTFSTPGTFTYYCKIHPNMHGTVVVEAQAGSDTSTPAPAATTAAPSTSTAAPSTPGASVTQTPNQACTLTVKDFTVAPGSRAVLVPDAQQVDAGYVVIHESTATGGVGDVIGSSAYLPGGSNNVNIVVNVDRPLKDGETVWPMLHTENNGNQTYDGAAIDVPTFSTQCGNTDLGNMATFPAKVTVSSNAPVVAATGSGVTPAGNSNAALLIVLGGVAVALSLGVTSLAVVRRTRN